MVAADGPADGLHGLRVLRGFPPACCAWSGVFGTGSRAAPQGCGRSQGPNCTGACAPTRPSPPTEDPQGCRGSYWEVGLNQACVLCVGFCPVLCLSFPGGRCLRLQGVRKLGTDHLLHGDSVGSAFISRACGPGHRAWWLHDSASAQEGAETSRADRQGRWVSMALSLIFRSAQGGHCHHLLSTAQVQGGSATPDCRACDLPTNTEPVFVRIVH